MVSEHLLLITNSSHLFRRLLFFRSVFQPVFLLSSFSLISFSLIHLLLSDMTTSSSDLTSNSSSITTNLPNITNFVPIKLDEHNFLNWKHQILTILKTLGLLKFLNQHIPVPPVDSAEREQWDRSDGYVSTFITASLSSSFLYLARGTQTSSELWKNIEDSFSQQLFAKQNQ
ncbi:hypothetical protein Hdeb2414_s0008g00290591 [Helianthus debilis subsp. tardiflorus]